MAADLSRKRKRAHISYREPSSDDDFSDLDIDNPSRRKQPTRRSARHHSTEAEPEAESSTRQPRRTTSPVLARSAGVKRTLRRKGRNRVSYRDESTDEESEDDGEADYEPPEEVVQRKPRSNTASRRSTPRKRSDNVPRKAAVPKKRAFGASLKEKKGKGKHAGSCKDSNVR